MDKIISVIRRCLPFFFPLPESEDHNEDVQSNSTTGSTSASSQFGWDHDVFLSFRGEDTRKNFIDHLYSTLVQVGIHTFRDDKELQRGKTISIELPNAIRKSRISIVVFSKDYASSRWCLDELVEIVQCRKTIGHILLPIFYHVDPLVVRKQTGIFAKAFARHGRFHTDKKRVQRWREALTEAANCSGWVLQNLANGDESRIIDEIVEEVLCKVNPTHLDVAIHPVGIQSRVEDIKALLDLETNNVCIVGFCGMGGIGKTTLAKAVYNEICHGFQGSSFLLNVKEKSKESNGLIHLQEQLLHDILHKKNWNVYNVDRGITLIKERIQGKKVLVVLDDVDHLDQLHALGGLNFKLFGPGSRLIATTRDEQLLDLLEVDKKYKVNELNHWESLRLFKRHAFKMTHPIKEHLELSVSVVKYTGGLPLALVVLGSSLFGKNVAEWKSKLEKLQKIPNGEIQEKLKTSFDSLEYETREIFLDIACFFIGMEKEYVIKVLLACDFSVEDGLGILIQRSLVTIEVNNKLRMHDLIRDMGRGIVYAESPRNPGRRSRVWFHKDIVNVLSKNTGSEIVEGLVLNHHVLEGVPLKTDAFKNMKNLRLLQINFVHLTGSYEDLSKELKWLCWHKCPLEVLPPNFHLENLVVLDMQYSNVKQLWKKTKSFNKLKILNLSNSKDLTTLPDFSQVPELEILILEGCTSLVQVHESIGHLKRLFLFNLRNCTNLKYLPRSTFNLESLKTLDWSALEKSPEQLPSSFGLFLNLKDASFSGCSNLTELPNFLHVPHLERLELEGCTSLFEIHESIGLLNRLVFLNLKSCKKLRNLPSSIFNLESLETLHLSNCSSLEKLPKLPAHLETLILEGCTRLVEIHESIGLLKRLVLLNLRSCKKFKNLPSSISNLESLETLDLWECYNVEELPNQLGNLTALKKLNVGFTAIKKLPSSFSLLKNLENLIFFRCECLIESPEFSKTSHLKELTFEGCTSLVKIHESIGHLKRLELLNLKRCKKLRNLPISNIFNLESLRVPMLSNCSSFDKLLEQWWNMKALWTLVANGTPIEQLPSSLGDLSNIGVLTLPGCGGPSSSWISPDSSNRMSLLSIFELCSLTELDLNDRNLFEDELPEFECLSSLEKLYLSGNKFCNLPICISYLPKLKYLRLSECTSLQSISFPRSVISLTANGCTSLETISILTNESSESSDLGIPNVYEKVTSDFDLGNCRKLVEIQNFEKLRCVPSSVQMGSCNNLSLAFRKSVLQMMCKTDILCSVILPGSGIPNWISHQAMGSSVSFRMPPFLDGKIGKVLLCLVYAVNKEAPRDILDQGGYFIWRLCNKSSRDQSNNWYDVGRYKTAISGASDFDIFEDHIVAQVRAGHASDTCRLNRIKMKSGDEIVVAIDLQMRGDSINPRMKCGIDPQIMEVKRCGIHFVVDDDDEPSVRDDEISETESEDSRL